MQRGNSEERITSANSSPRSSHKSASTLFGFFAKRSTKVEPHQNNAELLSATGDSRERDVSFAKCSPDKKTTHSPTLSSNDISSNHLNNNVSSSPTSYSTNVKVKSQTLPPTSSTFNNNFEKSYSSGFIFQRCLKPSSASKPHSSGNRHSAEGLQSAGVDVVLRNKSPKHRSPKHNRFSHQFSLCCKAERRPMTPPVTVRYNSGNATKRQDLSQSWDTSAETLSPLSYNTTDVVVAASGLADCLPPPLQPPDAATINACASAPQSPVTAKPPPFPPPNTSSHSSPSNTSQKSTQSAPNNGAAGSAAAGPIRPIAVTACRSRLRLKLLPPGKEMPNQPQLEAALPEASDPMRRTTTPQHMSSPNIATQSTAGNAENPNAGVRFLSHENIQMQKQTSQGSGLALQALMAAQVLSLIPTEKARERTFMDGRLSSSTLMGPSELNRVLPTREVTIFIGTWNMNGQNPPKQMNDFVLPTTVEHVPDIVAMGTQESSSDRFEWEVTIQETLGPSHVLFHATTLGTLHLVIFMRRDLIWYCSAPEDASLSVRTGTAFRTKGAVAISFCLFGTSMLFVTSHLTAHQQKVKERVSDVKRIIHALDLPKNHHVRHKNKDVTQNFDIVFWCGDLNFRLGEPREKLLEWIQHTKFPLPSHLPHGYMHTDQLSSVLADGAAFRGFMEANITFPPTYKYDPGTQHFDTSSKQRAPAYTDRILYKFRQPQGLTPRRQSSIPTGTANTQPYIRCLLYDSVPSIITSDHKPVLALFKALIRAGTDTIPLAGGLFNRDIYLEGMKRRLNNQYSGSSAVCSIQ